MKPLVHPTLSLVRGAPLADEGEPGALTVAGYLKAAAGRYGPREAVVMRGAKGRVSWTYDELQERSAEVARALIASGAGKDSRIGVLMANRPEYLAAVFGIAMAGGVTVALGTFSTAPELERLLSLSAVSLLLFDERVLKQDFATMLSSEDFVRRERLPYLQRLVQLASVTDDEAEAAAFESWSAFLGGGKGIADCIVEARAAGVAPSDVGGIFFSSGTTSAPKGVVHAQRAFAIQWRRWPQVMGMKEPVRSWTGNGLFWSGNMSMVVGTAFSTGGAAILQPTFDAESALEAIEKERVTFLTGRPHQWARLNAAPNWARADLSSLKYVTRSDLITEHPSVTADWKAPMSFGATETMTINTSVGADFAGDAAAAGAGPPLPGNTLKIVDRATDEILPKGARGEMCVKGPTLMIGYLGKGPEECFDAEGFYRTGDGGFIDDAGNFHWEGRLDDMIKSGGALVSPEEVDAAIAAFAGVKRVKTVGVADRLLGEKAVACIVPVGAPIDKDALLAHLKARLASFKLPRDILFLSEEEFPLTANEKVRTSDLRAIAEARLRT